MTVGGGSRLALAATAAAVCLTAGLGAPALASTTGDDARTVATTFATPRTGSPAAAVPTTIDTELTGFADEVLSADQPFTATVVVSNGSALPLENAAVRVRVTRSPLADTVALDRFLASASGPMREVGRGNVGASVQVEPDPEDPEAEPTTVSRLSPGVGTTLMVTVQPEDLGFPQDGRGVYGVVVELETEDGVRRIDSGVVTWAGSDIPNLEVAAVATASGAPSTVRSILAAATVPGVAIAADPTALSTVGATEVVIPAQEAFLLPSLHPDLVSLAHASDQTLLPYAVGRSRAAVPESAGEVPWLAVVAAFDAPTVAWAQASGAAGVLLERAYVDTPATGAALPPAVAAAAVEGGSVPVLLPEPILSEQVALADPEDVTSAGAVLAYAALLAEDATAPLLVSPGTEWNPTGADPSVALDALMSAPFVSPMPVMQLLTEEDAAPLAVPALAGQGDDASAEDIAALTESYEAAAELSTVAEDPAQVLDPAASTLIAPLATRLRALPDTRDSRVDFALASVDGTLSALSVAAGSDVNLIAAKGSVPVTVRNGLDVAATVVVDVTSLSPNLQIRDAPQVTIPAGQAQTVLVEVEAVSSADVETVVVLRAPGGEIVGEPATLSVRVRADWGNAVTAVFTAGLVLLLVAGVWRTVRRGRKDTRTGPQPAPDAPPEAEAAPEPTSAPEDAR